MSSKCINDSGLTYEDNNYTLRVKVGRGDNSIIEVAR